MKAIVVTGGTRGIGFEIARLFATRPMNAEAVVLTGTDPARLADAAAAIQAEILDQRISNVSRVIPYCRICRGRRPMMLSLTRWRRWMSRSRCW
ncbi:hypothetical protein [Ketogulonicigenium vulgare]|uniref:Uncharacterized protein n=1 Tax=Ketogulonicigenium vulgare (strain WSH-001) TaxID=759362 RepID=F9Y824_KETVW|nr:hypothetical protein [Ketogulonicigenium vulgare]ADO42963.1 hypothetical protein EIO_1846 [Ketogulonicigenium vulgare Y25]AEM41150.1 hypothetical protein KVU_1311 [Ketogulonicigenium vulgare WSH-001]ALJ81288.1 hypothetical protein KVH_08900 [Ketogulonicigenium vulgare]ANW35067.1 hypothetical protein KvSKV_08870 [Ketogulonicigenium vulgare]AOZ54872.1 hypothetical protein KVC_1865 [Ketogulonicigenium vulgare]